MRDIVPALVIAFVLCVVGYLGLKHIKDGAREAGAASVALRVQDETTTARALAAQQYQRMADELQRTRAAYAQSMVAYENELAGLRDERKADGDGDPVVFDQRWRAWVHGARRPGDLGAGVAGH